MLHRADWDGTADGVNTGFIRRHTSGLGDPSRPFRWQGEHSRVKSEKLEHSDLYSKKENWLPAVRQFVILGWTRFFGKSRKAPQTTRLRQHICELRTISFRIKSKRRADVRPQGRDGVLPEIREPQRPQRLPMPGFARKDRPGMLRQCHRAESHCSQLLKEKGDRIIV